MDGHAQRSITMSTNYLGTKKAVMFAAVVSIAGMSMAQSTETIKPSGSFQTGPAVLLNTGQFFPQIDETFKARPFSPENPSNPFPFVSGPANNLKMGTGTNSTMGTPGARFPGISATGWIPPDPTIAVGPTYIVETVNGAIAFFDKAGNKVFQQSDSNTGFWSGMGAGAFIFDPKVFYDHIAKRYVVIELEQDDATTTSKMLIAVSDDNNPNGNWFRYRIEAKINAGGDDKWFDYPGWGYNKDGFVTCGNFFSFASGGAVVRAIAFQKTPMLTGASAVVSWFDLDVFSVQVTRTMNSTGNPNSDFCYGVGRKNSTTMRLHAWGGLGTASPTMSRTDVSVPSYTGAGNAPSLGGGSLASIGDRMMSTAFRDGHLVFAHSIRNTVDASRNSAGWYDVNVGTWPNAGVPALLQSGAINLAGEFHSIVPGIAMNKFGDISVVFTRSSANTTAEMVYAARKKSDPVGTMGTPVVLATSPGKQTTNRFGDYATVEIDPSDDFTFWGITNTFGASNNWTTDINSWKVSTSSGGGGGISGTAPSAVATYFGTFISGNLASVATSDDNNYQIDSKMNSNAGQYAIATMDFTSSVAASAATAMDVSVEATYQGGTGGVSGTLFLYNHSTGVWDSFKSFVPVNIGNPVISITLSSGLSKYIHPTTKQVRVMVRTLETVSRLKGKPVTHRLKVDQGIIQVS